MAAEERTEYARAASGYVLWPLALIALIREGPAASRWARIHARQALVFGLASTFGYLLLLAAPLLVVIADPAISTRATIVVYAVGLLADVLVFFSVVGFVLFYSGQAARGELFSIPLVSWLADGVFRLRR